MTYAVKEIFYTLQGEGAQAGRPAVFCRFAGCNLWSGPRGGPRRARSASSATPISSASTAPSGGKFATPTALADAVARLLAARTRRRRFVVCTGGEPLLQLDAPLIAALHARGFEIAIETNGTLAAARRHRLDLRQPEGRRAAAGHSGDELKLVVPQAGLDPLAFAGLDFRRFSVQPMDGPDRVRNTEWAVAYCLAHPQWQLSLQTHKMTGIR